MDQSENRFYREREGAAAHGGPAFPCHTNPRPGHLVDAPQGMTLRDYFAAKVMGTLIAVYDDEKCSSEDPEVVERERQEFAYMVAKNAYRYADAMLRAREAA